MNLRYGRCKTMQSVAAHHRRAAGDVSPGSDLPQGAAATTPTPVNTGRVLLIHGYSAAGKDLMPWKQALCDARIVTVPIEVGNYISLNNEITLKDLGEAFDRALRLTPWSTGSKDDSWTFDVIVHSTGMLVLRQWLVSDPFPAGDPRSRLRRLKHLVGLAPATFGSPQAKQGRSFLGALVKGNRDLGPDFLNAGDAILDGLELASSYTWNLTHKDMLCASPFYDKGANTPYVTVFVGDQAYSGIASIDNPPGSDGTVRWAGCSLNTRKVSLDFRREPRLLDANGDLTRCNLSPWESSRLGAPVIAVSGKNHGTLVSMPDPTVVDLVGRFLNISEDVAYQSWEAEALAFGEPALAKMDAASKNGATGGAGWQQLMVHVVDDHGDAVSDYNLKLFTGRALTDSDDPAYPAVPLIVDTFSGDNSYRCFYLRLSPEMLTLNDPGSSVKKIWLELIASSGSKLIQYEAYTGLIGEAGVPQSLTIDHSGGSPVKLDLTALTRGEDRLLYPYTTTLLEVFIEREPTPLGKISDIFNFLTSPADPGA